MNLLYFGQLVHSTPIYDPISIVEVKLSFKARSRLLSNNAIARKKIKVATSSVEKIFANSLSNSIVTSGGSSLSANQK